MEKSNFIILKELVHQEDIIIQNMYSPKKCESEHQNKNFKKKEIYEYINKIEDFKASVVKRKCK